jgi:hypothetical protein
MYKFLSLFNHVRSALHAGAGPLTSDKEPQVTKDEADRLVLLAQAGAPIPEGVMRVALVRTGDTQVWSFRAMQEADEFVDALRKEGLL